MTDADDPPSRLRVTLHYYLANSYQGSVRMHYDSGRGLFTDQLPAVDAGVLNGDAGVLSATIEAIDPAGRGPRPEINAVAPVDSCMGTIHNSP